MVTDIDDAVRPSCLSEELVLCPVLETKDKPRISYSEIRGYSEVKFWRFSNIFILGLTILGITQRCL